MLNIKYWCPNENLKKQLIKKYNENEKQYQKEIREVYNSDNLFKNRNKNSDISEVNEVENTVTMVEYKESFISRIINKIKQLFKKVQ